MEKKYLVRIKIWCCNVVNGVRIMKQKWVVLNDKIGNIRETYELEESKTIRDYIAEHWIVCDKDFTLLVEV